MRTFNIVRYHGQRNKAFVEEIGLTVYRADKILVPEYGRFIPCAQYDEHFIFEVPPKYKDIPSFMCTCGSVAVIAGMSSYQHDASPQGLMFVCLNHATYGVHVGGSRWI